MQSQSDQDEIADYTLPNCANESMSVHSQFKGSIDTNSAKINSIEPNSLPQVKSESISSRKKLDSSLTINLENSGTAKIKESSSMPGAKNVSSHKKTRNKIKTSCFTSCRKRKIPEN